MRLTPCWNPSHSPQTNVQFNVSQPDQDNLLPLDMENQFFIVTAPAQGDYEVVQQFLCCAHGGNPLEQPTVLHLHGQASWPGILICGCEISQNPLRLKQRQGTFQDRKLLWKGKLKMEAVCDKGIGSNKAKDPCLWWGQLSELDGE